MIRIVCRPKAKGLEDSAQGFDAFVPEGQADRRQARSAWVAMQKGPVPEGRSIGSIVPLGRGYYIY
jgi:hypothetical protein